MKVYNGDFDLNKGKVVIEFMAPWCVWCKRLAPLMTNLEPNYPDLTFISVDIDKYESIFDQYKLEVVPTLVLLNDGEVVDILVNPQSVTVLEEGLAKYNG